MAYRLVSLAAVVCAMTLAISAFAKAEPAAPGTVCHVKVVSDKVPDVTSLEAWKKSFIEPAKTNQDKAIAIWRSVITFQYQDGGGPNEFLHQEDAVYDPIKMFNVYGYGICSLHSAQMDGLSRAVGFPSRGWAINGHSVCEMNYDGSWHHFDSSLMHYFLRPDGSVASIEDVFAAVKEWYDKHPDYVGIDSKERDKKLRDFEFRNGRTGWKEGPALLASSPQLNAKGWWPAGTHGWYATMQEFDGTAGKQKAYIYEYSPSMGYEVNIQLRKGERITRNWANTGMHIDQDGGGKPSNLADKEGFLKNNQAFCDKIDPAHPNLTNGRIGNGRHEYTVPLDDKELAATALTYENLQVGEAASHARLGVKDQSKPGILIIRMPSSYIYLGGEVALKGNASADSPIKVSISDNNGMDWKEVATVTSADAQKFDLRKFILRRYDYRLKFELKSSSIQSLAIGCDIQHSQRPLPALDQGDNKITFSAGPQTSTITYEANNKSTQGGKQVAYTDYHPILDSIKDNLTVQGKEGKLTIPVAVPGEMTGLRIGCCYRTWGDTDTWEMQASFDEGKTFKKVGEAPAQKFGASASFEVKDIPAGTKAALVRYVGKAASANMMHSFRIDADYKSPTFGFAPVKVTYVWDDNGQEKKDEHVAAKADDTWTIKCDNKPKMKSIILELAN